jgi:isopropylmalate/homocitrate/citramalate synthase
MAIREELSDLIDVPSRGARPTDRTPPKIYDTTLRDGEQTPGVAFTPQQKLTIATALARAGVHILDVGFPAASPSDAEALRLILEARRRGDIPADVEILVMSRTLPRDIDATAAAVAAAGLSLDAVTLLLFTSGSSLHVKYKLGPSLLSDAGRPVSELRQTPVSWFHAANIDRLTAALEYATSRGATSIEFGAEDASRTPLALLLPLIAAAVEHGAKRYTFADTIGVMTPDRTAMYCRGLREAFPDLPLVAHFHNDFDLATSNTVAAYLHGMDILSVTTNGIGERAGNAPLHCVVAALRHLHGVEIPGFRYEMLSELSALVANASEIPLALNEPIVGRNAFSHESGIHVQGVLVDPTMYEPLTPESVGSQRLLVFGKHSGVAGVQHVLMGNHDRLGLSADEIDQELVLAVTREIKTKREEEAVVAADRYTADRAASLMTEVDVVRIAQNVLSAKPRSPVPAMSPPASVT